MGIVWKVENQKKRWKNNVMEIKSLDREEWSFYMQKAKAWIGLESHRKKKNKKVYSYASFITILFNFIIKLQSQENAKNYIVLIKFSQLIKL